MTTPGPFRDPRSRRAGRIRAEDGSLVNSSFYTSSKYYLLFRPTVATPHLQPVAVMLGDGQPTATANGGWTFVARPKNLGFTTWVGYDPYVLTIPLMFDGHSRDESVEEAYEALRRIMRVPVGKERQPSPVKIDGSIPHSNLSWVIQSIEPGNEIRRSRDGRRTRIECTLTAYEYMPADVLVEQKASPAKQAAAKAATTGGPAQRTYTVKRGDTLVLISTRLLGTHKRWQEIARLNGVRDPRKLRVGQVLKIPT